MDSCSRCTTLAAALTVVANQLADVARVARAAVNETSDILAPVERATVTRLRAYVTRYPGDQTGLIGHDVLVLFDRFFPEPSHG